MYTSGSCGGSFATFFTGYRLVYRISLGDDTPLGGVLTISTCGLTTNNTVLYVGSGCPTWSGSFGCVASNDNAADVAGRSCPSNPRASTVVFTLTSSRVAFVQLGGYGGLDITSGISWAYEPRSPSKTASRTRTKMSTRTRTRSMSRKKKALLAV